MSARVIMASLQQGQSVRLMVMRNARLAILLTTSMMEYVKQMSAYVQEGRQLHLLYKPWETWEWVYPLLYLPNLNK